VLYSEGAELLTGTSKRSA